MNELKNIDNEGGKKKQKLKKCHTKIKESNKKIEKAIR